MATQMYIFPPLSTASLQNPSKLATPTTLRLIRILALTQLLVSLILDLSIHWKGGRWITYFTNIGHSTIILYYITTLSFPLHHWKKTTYVLHTLALNMQLLIPLVYWSLLAQNFVHQSPLKQYLNVSAHAIATFLILIESACNKIPINFRSYVIMLTALLTYFAYVMILSHVFTDKKLGGRWFPYYFLRSSNGVIALYILGLAVASLVLYTAVYFTTTWKNKLQANMLEATEDQKKLDLEAQIQDDQEETQETIEVTRN